MGVTENLEIRLFCHMRDVNDINLLQVSKQLRFFPTFEIVLKLSWPLLQLSVRRKNTKEMFGGFLKSVVKSADEVLFSGVKVR